MAPILIIIGSPGTGKTQVLKRLLHTLIQEEFQVALCATLALLATAYRKESSPDLQADTVLPCLTFPSPNSKSIVNYQVGKYDAVTIDEASMVAEDTFALTHESLEKQVHCLVVIIAGDEFQQPPLQTISGKTVQTA